MLRVAFKDLLARRRRLVTTAIAVILGIAFLAGTQLLSAALSESIDELVDDIYEPVDAVVRSPDAQESPFGQALRNPVPSDLVDRVKAVDGVAAAAGMVENVGPQLIGPDDKVIGGSFGPPTLVYNWIDEPELQLGKIIEGGPPTADDDVVLDFATVEDLGAALGDEVRITNLESGVEAFTLVGVIGLGEDGTRSTGARPMLFTTPTAMRLLGQPDQYNYITVAAEEGLSQEELADALAEALPDQQTLTGAAFVEESQESVSFFVDILTVFVSVFGYIALFVAVFIIYNTFSITVAQRTRETALLRAIGAKRRQVLAATLFEALVIGLIAAIGGLIVGLALAWVLLRVLGGLFTIDTGVPPLGVGTVVFAVVVGVVVTVISAIAPAIRSTRVPPIAALSDVAIDRSGLSLSRRIWGTVLVLIGIALIFVGVSVDLEVDSIAVVGLGAAVLLASIAVVVGPAIASPVSRGLARIVAPRSTTVGRLAGENAARNPRRTSATAAALTIGVTLVVLIAVVASSIKTSVNESFSSSTQADFVVASASVASLGNIPRDVAEQVAALDDVAVSSALRFGMFRLLDDAAAAQAQESPVLDGTAGALDTAPPGQDEFLIGVDPRTWFQVVDPGAIDGSLDDLDESSLLVSRFYAEDRGWELGDTVPVFFAASGQKDLTVDVIFDNPMGDTEVIVPMETFEANMLPPFNVDVQIYVQATDGADLVELRSQLDEIVADIPTVVIQDLAEYIETQTAPFDTFLAIVYGLLGLAVVIALIGIANTLSLSVFERTRELGMLRAVGMSRRQLRRMIRLEAGIIAAFGSLLGVALGVGLSAALTAAISSGAPGGSITYHLPVGQLVVIAAVASMAGVLAALLPARRAARLDPLTAIHTL